jgi:hypothetical protein
MDDNIGLDTPVMSRADAIRTGGRTATKPAPRVPLGAELPLFCEKCGYSLHGMPAARCDHCTILQFHCPECGHHQPINTLRPAAHRILGRLRAVALALNLFVKLNFFGWLLFAWGAMAIEWSYTYTGQPFQVGANGRVLTSVPSFSTRPIDLEAIVAHMIFALAFGIVGRMLLLRWRRGWAVGLVLGALVSSAYLLGGWFTYWERQEHYAIVSPFSADFILLVLISAATVAAGAAVAWSIWSGLAKLLLPAPAATSMLAWQRSMSDPSSLARQ